MSTPLPVPFARHAADAEVAFGGDGPVTAARLRGKAAAVAEALRKMPGTGERVLVVCRDRVAFTAALCGAWEAGLGVALPPNAQPETLRAIRRLPGVLTVLHDGEGERGVDITEVLDGAAPSDAPVEPVPADRYLATVYTSGTTGDHRACTKTAGQLLGEVDVLLRTFDDTQGARVAAVVPPHHIYGLLFGVLVPLCGGGSFHRKPPPEPARIAAELARHDVRVLVSVPAHLAGLRVVDELPAVHRVLSSGAPLLEGTAQDLAARAGWRVTEVLGSSETGGIAWRDRDGESAPPWEPLAGVRVEVGDDDRMLLDSPMLPPDWPRPWPSADRARLLPDGRFEHLGRADGVLKIGSKRVSVAQLEQRLASIDGVQDVAVLPVHVGGTRGWETWAALVAPGLDAEAVRAELRRWLEPVVLPRRYRFVDALPRTDRGKIRQDDLRALFDVPARGGDR